MAVRMYPNIADEIAHLPGMRRNMIARTNAAAGKAKAKLARRRDQGHSHIDHWVGDTDGHVALVDPHGGAMSIEYGRPAGSESGESRGVRALQGIWK